MRRTRIRTGAALASGALFLTACGGSSTTITITTTLGSRAAPSGPPGGSTTTSMPTTSSTAPTTSVPKTVAGCRTNLIGRTVAIPVYIVNESWSSAHMQDSANLRVSFRNSGNGSGVALHLPTPLDVGGFRSVELRGSSTHAFSFVIQFKLPGEQTPIVQSAESVFPRTPAGSADVKIVHLAYPGRVQEVVVNFDRSGQSSDVVFSAICLANR